MVLASIVVADVPVYSISRDRLFAAIGARRRGAWARLFMRSLKESDPESLVAAGAKAGIFIGLNGTAEAVP
jgi:hypothetical protein